MRLWQDATVGVVMGAAVSAVVTTLAMACSGPQLLTNGVQAADVAAYGADLEDCIQGAATKAQAQRCMATVRYQWCGPEGRLKVQGACSYDAGPPPASSGMGPTLDKLLDKGLEAGWIKEGDR